jgi:hypothetical protein
MLIKDQYMKKTHVHKLALCLAAVCLSTTVSAENKPAESAAKPVHGSYLDWRLLSVSHREDKKTLRAILGNDTAIDAARSERTKPWPDGSILAKVVWKESTHPNWPQAIVPGEFASAEAMVKDSAKYASTGGWGFGRWEAGKLVMHEEAKAKECFACHSPMQHNDYVYTFGALK